MRRFRCAALAAFAVLGFASVASAADLPTKAPIASVVAPTSNWTGFYAGVNGGYGFGSADTSLVLNAVEAGFISGFNPLPGTLHPNGFIGGGQIGYNYDFGNLVAGVEADLSYAGLRKTDSATGTPFLGGTLTTTVETKLNWFGTFRARLGILPTNNLLVYATGGLAYGEVQTTTTGSNIPGFNCNGLTEYCASGSTTGVSVGWTLGGGLEYAIERQWTVKAEYLYLNLGNRSVTFPDTAIAGGVLTASTNFTAQFVRAGFNYRF
jgi:outer membrane immunogenic protein